MDLSQALMAARQKRKEIATANEAVRQAIFAAIERARATDDRWSVDTSPDAPLGIANSILYLSYRTARQFDSKTAWLNVRIEARDGGLVDLYDERGKLLLTAHGAEVAIQEVARLVAEFEWPNEAQY